MNITIAELAKALNDEAVGNLHLVVKAPAEPADAGPGDIALAMNPRFVELLPHGKARAALLAKGTDWEALGLEAAILIGRSRAALSTVSKVFDVPPQIEEGIHPTAIIDPTARIGQGASIGPFVVIGGNVEIGESARIFSHCAIAENVVIGRDCLLLSGVRIGARVVIGDRFMAQTNANIGTDGFSFVPNEAGGVEQAKQSGGTEPVTQISGYLRINSLGSVVIGDDVEIGGGATIDRGTVSDTRIGEGTKIDNMVHVAHNVQVGRHCLLCAQVGIAGSSVIGDRVVLGGQVGVADHVTVGSDVIAAGKSGISSNVPPQRMMMGNPAIPMDQNVGAYKVYRRLPRLVAKVEELQKQVSKLLSKH